ncbi:phage tail spike protein [Mammaliicoccus sciuri]|uniref:phage tail spike protein n=1 Tax=Mammaliicoccus sciuri TaxID=1296 RepID=UPI0020C132E2|nr:phage tail spike protein [Mammaliicoccus sciuri]
MIHVLNFNSEIIDFISQDDSAIIRAEHTRSKEDKSELLNITLLSERAEHFKERNRVIIQEPNGAYKEFIINRLEEEGQYLEIECDASYVEDIGKAKPIPAGKFTKMTVNEALSETLKDSGWEVGLCEYGGIKSMSWTSVRTPHEMISQLTTTYKLEPDYVIEIKGNEVVRRKVNMIQPKPLFEGKEIIYGKDLISMKRTVDMSEVKTALFAFGPEKDDGTRISTVVVDDEAQQQFNLPKRYLWGIYEPESDDQDMTLERLITLTKTELNKRKSSALSYEIDAFDLEKEYPHEIIRFGDIVRIKNPDYTPSLYAESEVIGYVHELISDDLTWQFGNVIEYKEDDLLKYFRSRMEEIEKKLTNNINNSNTIITDRIDEEIERLQRSIHRGETPPPSPEEGDFWYDTSNSKVAVLREFKNGRWENASAHDVEQIGGMTKEAIIYNEINGTFLSISVQHAKMINEVYEVLNSEYLVDEGIRDWLNNELNILLDIYSNITSSLDSMTVETATIGKLMDTQAMIVQYRGQAYALNTAFLNARQAIDERFKLLQSQYTDEKYNEAMQKVADVIGGTYDAETGQLIADIPNKETLEEMRVTIENAMNNMSQENEAKLQELQNGITQTNQRITATSEELSAGITSVTKKVEGLQTDGNNLVRSFLSGSPMFEKTTGTTFVDDTKAILNSSQRLNIKFYEELNNALLPNTDYTLKIEESSENLEVGVFYKKGSYIINGYANVREIKFNTLDRQDILIVIRATAANQFVNKISLYRGLNNLSWSPAPEDTDKQLSDIKTSVQTQSADIQLIKEGIKLKADSSEVTKIYNDYLTPLQTQVNAQKATLDILPSQIAAKVSQSQYNADMNNVVGRLDSAEAESVVMANQIKDRVTINEYNNMKIGTENLLLNSLYQDKSTSSSLTHAFFRYYLTTPLKVGKTYTFTCNFNTTDTNQSGRTSVRGYTPDNGLIDVDINEGKIKVTFVAKVESSTFLVYKDVAGTSPHTLNVNVTNAMLVEGDKIGDYQQAPQEQEERLDTIETSIEQNGKDIELKASEEEFNKTKQTLSKIATEILMNTTTGVTISYDDNGNVNDVNVGPSGVKLNTNVFEINDGDVIVKNGVTTIKDAYIDKLFSKQATINYLNSVDITAKRIEAKDNKASVNIENGTITMTRADGHKLDMGINGIEMLNPDGSKRFSMDRLLVTSAALGTSNSNVYLAAQQGYEVRAVDITQIPSDGAWDSYRYVPVRALAFVGNKLMTNGGTNLYLGTDSEVRVTARGGYNGEDTVYRNMRALGYYGDFIETNSVTSGVNIYIRPDSNAEVRFTARGTTDNYIDIRAKNVYGSSLISRDSGNLYLGTDDGVRVTGKSLYNGGSPIWRNLAANGLYANFLDINPNTNAVNLYLRADGEVRITKRNTTDSYIPIRAASATWTSSERYKYDIENWDIDVLEHLVDRVQLYSYKLYSEIEEDSQRVRHGVVLERETPDEWKNGDGVDSYEMTAWCLKAIQELTKKVRRLETELEAK